MINYSEKSSAVRNIAEAIIGEYGISSGCCSGLAVKLGPRYVIAPDNREAVMLWVADMVEPISEFGPEEIEKIFRAFAKVIADESWPPITRSD